MTTPERPLTVGPDAERREDPTNWHQTRKTTSTPYRTSLPSFLIPSLGELVFFVAMLLGVGLGSWMLSSDGDAARHLTVGEFILSSGEIPRRDVFSHTMAGEPLVPYEWLAEVASATSYRWAGLAGPVLLHGGAIALAFALVFGQIRRRGHPPLLALAVTALAAAASLPHWLARPHVFTFLGAALFASVLDGWYRGNVSSRWLWALPAVMGLWANLHGGFLVGLLLLSCYMAADVLRWLGGSPSAAAEARTRLTLLSPVLAATCIATLFNPVGATLLSHTTGYLGKTVLIDRTIEYMSPNFHEPRFLPFLGMVLLGLFGMAWARPRPAIQDGLIFAGFLIFALYAQRNVALFAIVAAAPVASQLAGMQLVAGRLNAMAIRSVRWLGDRNSVLMRMDQRARGHVLASTTLILLMALAVGQLRHGLAPLGTRFDESRQPVAAVAYLQDHPPVGNGFNELKWGGYVLFRLWPAQQVFIDGQTDFYGEPLVKDYIRVVELHPGWYDLLERHQVRWVLYHSTSPLVEALAARPQWRVVYRDRVAAVLVLSETEAV